MEITNLMLYPADIICEGCINSNPRRVDFCSPNSNDKEDNWCSLSHTVYDTISFEHVLIKSKLSGYEKIITEFIIEWPHKRKDDFVQVGIDVKSI